MIDLGGDTMKTLAKNVMVVSTLTGKGGRYYSELLIGIVTLDLRNNIRYGLQTCTWSYL